MTNNNIYKYLTGILRKSRKGNALDPDTFTEYLQQANLEFFNKEWNKYLDSQRLVESFKPLLTRGLVYSTGGFASLPSDFYHLISGSMVYNSKEVDFITPQEYGSRLYDELTQPTSDYPIAYFRDNSNIFFGGIATDPVNPISFLYIKTPDDPYFDYYIDANSEVQYLTEGQSAYTLQTDEVYRDGTTSGAVTSISKELDWTDSDKIKVANIILGYLGVQLEDQASYQHSNVQEQQDKAEYISYIKNLLPKVDQTVKYHDKVVSMAISTALEQVFNEVYMRETKNLDQYAIKYAISSNPTSLHPEETGWAYYEFDNVLHFNGVHPINLPNKGKGVLRILAQDNTTVKFRPISHQEYQQMDMTEMGYYSDVAWYLVESERILFYLGSLLTGNTNGLKVYMIPKFFSMAGTDNFNIPLGQGARLLELTLTALQVVPPKDLVADNTDS